jgi:hypothetical protein
MKRHIFDTVFMQQMRAKMSQKQCKLLVSRLKKDQNLKIVIALTFP